MGAASGRKLTKAGSILPEKIEAYRKRTRAFRAKAGGEMGRDDPSFDGDATFGPDAATPGYRSAKDADSAMSLLVEVMGEAGVDPAAIYAFKRTGGLFPTVRMPLTPGELSKWNRAMDEYYEKFRNTRKQ
jgi:hypothetical protein